MGKLGAILQVGRAFGVRDGMLRLEYEFQRASGLMSWRMRSLQGWDAWSLRQISSCPSAETIRDARRDGSVKFFFDDARALGTKTNNLIGVKNADAVVADANRIVAGVVPFFDGLSFECGFPPRWLQNPVNGKTLLPNQPWTKLRFSSPVYDDLKFILEPSRFLFIYPLVRAYALVGDERFPEAFWRAIEDWARVNPPMAGPLWICGQESSLRIFAWTFALHGFVHSAATTPERVALLTSMIAAHAWRTAQTLGYSRSQRSNHLISEAVGLWTTGVLYPELREAKVWKTLGEHLLQQAVLDQITPQGVSHQHSFNYHRMNLHLSLWMLRLAEIQNISINADIRTRVEAAFDFLRGWIDPTSGLAPNYGADDGSLILPLATASHRDYRPLLQLGAAILDRPGLKPGPWDEAPMWLGVEPRHPAQPSTHRDPDFDSRTGYFRLGDEDSWAMIRAGHYIRRPFQADQLHVDLWWKGINLARDAGTYLYNGPAPWNNAFAGTAIHNTVTVDRRDQMTRAGRFLWVDWAQATGRVSASPGKHHNRRFEGGHDGFRNLGVNLRRSVQWLDGSGWAVVDDIEGSGEHDVRLHWLTLDLPHAIQGEPFELTMNSGAEEIRWNIFSSVLGNAAVVRAGVQTWSNSNFRAAEDAELLGWEAATYGDLRPAISMLYDIRSWLPVRLVTIILTGGRCKVKSTAAELMVVKSGDVDQASGESEIYRTTLQTIRNTNSAPSQYGVTSA